MGDPCCSISSKIFCLTVVEALSSGVLTIATSRIGAFDTLIYSTKIKLMHQPDSIEDSKSKLHLLLGSIELRHHIGGPGLPSAIEWMSLRWRLISFNMFPSVY